MRKLLLLLPLMISTLIGERALAQTELFDGLFDKEEPVFHAQLVPSPEKGAVDLVLYFTHSKLNNLEVSVWIKDQGAMLQSGSDKQLVSGLQTMGNRRQDTLTIRGLVPLHFYTIGIDFRNPGALSRKFNAKVLQEGYRYQYQEPQPPVASPGDDRTSPQPERPVPQPMPCVNPDILVKVDPAGYCGDANRPAVKVECLNCRDREWDFAVEVREENGYWTALRTDGGRHAAFGDVVRTEPLCLLQPGAYYVRVLAWGKQCSTPVIHTTGPVIVMEPSRRDWTAKSLEQAPTAEPSPAPALPEDCAVTGEATLEGDLISGTVELAAASPCGSFNPYVKIRYINPGYRDINLNRFPLIPGEQVPFDIRLDDRDLARGIHTLQVVIYVRSDDMTEGVPVNSFWIRADQEGTSLAQQQDLASASSYDQPKGTFQINAGSPQTYIPPPVNPDNGTNGMQARGSDEEPMAYASSLSENVDTVRVTATDPNCTQIQDLQLVFDPNRPDLPLFISWLSPRCCQEEGCHYSVWAGKDPDQLRLLVNGSKPGAFVRELLQGIMPSDQYFEVSMRTANGIRKAAYVMGEGPRYGIEDIMAYRDGLHAPVSDQLTFVKAPQPTYEKPERSVSDFESCKYRRPTSVVADEPIEEGDSFTIEYDFSERDYQYTLYFLPSGAEEWVLAPGTREGQSKPEFKMTATLWHSGKYLVLARKGNWGCLSAPPAEALEIKVGSEEE